MDPSIMKLLEDDEDETMHSGAAVEAFQAALNRDIEGDISTSSQTSESDAAFPHGSNSTSGQPPQATSQNENSASHVQQEQNFQQKQEHPNPMRLEQCASVPENQQQRNASLIQASQNKPQVDHKQGESEQVPVQFPQMAGMQVSDRASIPVNDSNRMQNRDNESQYLKLQKMSNQQAMASEQASNAINRSKQVPFALLLPVLLPQLDKDRSMQLQTLFNKLKRNEMNKDDFVRLMRGVVGDQMLKLAVCQVQSQPPPSARQLLPRIPPASSGTSNFSDPRPFAQLQKGMNSPAVSSYSPSSASQGQGSSGYPAVERNKQSLREVEYRTDGNGNQLTTSSTGNIQERERSTVPVSGLDKQHLHFQQKSFVMYGSSGNYHPYTGSNINASSLSLKPQPHESQVRQISQQATNFDRQVTVNDSKRVQGGTIPQFSNNLTSQQNPVSWQSSMSKEQITGPLSSMSFIKQEPSDQGTEQTKTQLPNLQGLSSISSMQVEQVSTTPGIVKESFDKQSSKMGFPTSNNVMLPTSANTSNSDSPDAMHDPSASLSSQVPSMTTLSGMHNRTPPKKSTIGQKKPFEALGSSPPLSSKKQKVSGAFSDQSIEQLNDVTAVSGVNIREEEEQLFSGSKEDSRASEASRKVVQEEEERLILQKGPLKKMLLEIMSKCGLKSMTNDVERCISLCVEERLRGIIRNLIRLSKQRVDCEKVRHRTFVTSDVRQQLMLINRKAREEWEKKQAEAEKLRKLNDPEDGLGVAGDKEKDEGRAKSVKVNKDEDDKMRTTAANVAARAAVGGDDMLSKWQLMAEQARQKREGGTDSATGSHSGKDATRKASSTAGRHTKDSQEADRKGGSKKFGRNQGIGSQSRVARSISVKDVIAVLQREPQMCKSTTIYRLYDRIRSEPTTEDNR